MSAERMRRSGCRTLRDFASGGAVCDPSVPHEGDRGQSLCRSDNMALSQHGGPCRSARCGEAAIAATGRGRQADPGRTAQPDRKTTLRGTHR